MGDRIHENREDEHPSASSLKLYQNLEDKHPSACSLKFKYQNLKVRHPRAHSLKRYVKGINVRLKYKGYFTQIFDLFLENKKLFIN